MDSGATAWVLISTALVLFMTPGLALFYGGMVRGKNVLGMLMQNIFAMGLLAILWAAVVFSLAFGDAGNAGFIGNLDYVWLTDVGPGLTTEPFFAGLGPIGEGRMTGGLVQVQDPAFLGDRSDQTLTHGQARDMDRLLPKSVGRGQFERIVAQQVDGPDLALHRVGDQVAEPHQQPATARGGEPAPGLALERRLRSADGAVDILGAAESPLTIPDILQRRPELAQSSVYRNLSVLEAAGVVLRIAGGDEFTRFELAEDLAPIAPKSGQIPFYSTVEGGFLDTAALDAGYWYRNLRGRVGFQPAVEALVEDGVALEKLAQALDGVHDLERLAGRAASGRATPRDLVALADTLRAVPVVREILEGLGRGVLDGADGAPDDRWAELASTLLGHPEVVVLIDEAIEVALELAGNFTGLAGAGAIKEPCRTFSAKAMHPLSHRRVGEGEAVGDLLHAGAFDPFAYGLSAPKEPRFFGFFMEGI